MARKPKQDAMFDLDAPAATNTTAVLDEPMPETSAPPVDGIADQGAAATGPKVERLSIPLTPDGVSVDMNTMRPKTAEKLRKVIEMTPALMPDKASLGPDGNVLPDAAVDAVYGILGRLEAMAAATRFPKEVASQVFEYTPQELLLLRPVTHPVINRYLKTYTKDRELIALVMVLAQVHFMKIAKLQMLMGTSNAATA